MARFVLVGCSESRKRSSLRDLLFLLDFFVLARCWPVLLGQLVDSCYMRSMSVTCLLSLLPHTFCVILSFAHKPSNCCRSILKLPSVARTGAERNELIIKWWSTTPPSISKLQTSHKTSHSSSSTAETFHCL